MKIPLYNIFGDNYIRQVAIEAEKYEEYNDYIEIDDKALRNVLDVASEIAKEKESTSKRGQNVNILPLSGNDKKAWESTLECYNFVKSATLSVVLKNFSETKECEEVTAPSFVKPEYYEFSRSPGYPGKNKSKLDVQPHYLIIAAAGWVLSRIGKAKLKEDDIVGINIFTDTRSLIYNLAKDINYIPGVKPETAFALWIASKLKAVNANPNVVKVYMISDAGGQQPTTIRGEFTLELGRLLRDKKEFITDELADIAKDALDSNSETKNYSAKVVTLIYEVLTGSKDIEELVYMANRDLVMNLESEDEKLRIMRKVSYYVNKVLIG